MKRENQTELNDRPCEIELNNVAKKYVRTAVLVGTFATTVSTFLFAQNAASQMAMDPSYTGSSFNELVSIIEDQGLTPQSQKELDEINVYKSKSLPQYRVNMNTLINSGSFPLFKRSKATLNERSDYYLRFKKWVHANGVCATGKWDIDKSSPYSGYFGGGASGLFIGRISVALQETTNAGDRGFGFAGKIFPTLDPSAQVETTSFFTVDVLSGTPASRFLDVALTNDPPLFPSAKIAGVLFNIALAFTRVDSSPTFRPVTQIANMARIGESGAMKAPVYIRLRSAAGTLKNNQADFRNEMLTAMAENHNQLKFVIDAAESKLDRNASTGASPITAWKPIGAITLNQAIVSYGCDRRLHFSHPRDDKSNAAAEKAAAEAKKTQVAQAKAKAK